MDVDEPVLGNRLGHGGPEQLTSAGAVQLVDAVDDQRLGLGEALREDLSKVQVLGGAGAATLAQASPPRCGYWAAVGQGGPYRFNQIEQRGVR